MHQLVDSVDGERFLFKSLVLGDKLEKAVLAILGYDSLDCIRAEGLDCRAFLIRKPCSISVKLGQDGVPLSFVYAFSSGEIDIEYKSLEIGESCLPCRVDSVGQRQFLLGSRTGKRICSDLVRCSCKVSVADGSELLH